MLRKWQLERMKQLFHEEAEKTLQFGEEAKAATKKIKDECRTVSQKILQHHNEN